MIGSQQRAAAAGDWQSPYSRFNTNPLAPGPVGMKSRDNEHSFLCESHILLDLTGDNSNISNMSAGALGKAAERFFYDYSAYDSYFHKFIKSKGQYIAL